MVKNHIVSNIKSRKDWVVGPLPNGLNGLYMGVILTTYKSWDDPPSKDQQTLNWKGLNL